MREEKRETPLNGVSAGIFHTQVALTFINANISNIVSKIHNFILDNSGLNNSFGYLYKKDPPFIPP